MAKPLKPFLHSCLLTAIICVSGCSTYSNIYPLTEKTYAPRPPDYPITLSTSDLQIAYEEIAVVRSNLYEDWAFEKAASAELKQIARRLGGDAVISLKTVPGFSDGMQYVPNPTLQPETKLQQKFSYKGTVVRYLRPSDSPLPAPPDEMPETIQKESDSQ